MAFLSPMAWEVRTTGSDNNGGGFDATSGTPGTDYSQQTSPQVAYTDLVIDPTTNTNCTSVATPFTSAHVGNVLNITAGTGFTVQRVQIISVAAGIATCDKSLGTLSSINGVANLGGCLATATRAAALVVAGNKVWFKATATYTQSTTVTFSTSGSSGLPVILEGYTTTRGDGGMATIQLTASSIIGFSVTGSQYRVLNFIFDGNSQTTSRGVSMDGNTSLIKNCKAMNCTASGFRLQTATVEAQNCWATACTSAPFQTVAAVTLIDCAATANSAAAFQLTTNRAVCIRCIAANNTGASSDGFQNSATLGAILINCVSYNNGRDGFRCTTSNGMDGASIRNCIFVSNAGYGINSATTAFVGASSLDLDYNAFYNNTSGARNQVPTGAHDVALSGDPFTNGASADFSLDNTASEGAACRAAGFPGALQAGGTGYLDIGALQHADPAGGGGLAACPLGGFIR